MKFELSIEPAAFLCTVNSGSSVLWKTNVVSLVVSRTSPHVIYIINLAVFIGLYFSAFS